MTATGRRATRTARLAAISGLPASGLRISLDPTANLTPSVVMDVLFYLLLGLLLPAGYVLGIIGFFRANSAHTQLAALRRQIAELLARSAAPVDAALGGTAAAAAPVMPAMPPATVPPSTPFQADPSVVKKFSREA